MSDPITRGFSSPRKQLSTLIKLVLFYHCLGVCHVRLLSLNAQKVKVKAGIVSIDKKPVAKVEGFASLFKGIDFTFFHMNGDTMLQMKMVSSDYFIPTRGDIFWHNMIFHNPKKEMHYLIGAGTNHSEKKIAEWIFVKTDPPIMKNGSYDVAAADAFIANNDATEKIKKDTAAYNEYEKILQERLNGPKVLRETLNGVKLHKSDSKSFANTTITVYDIIQGEKKIGMIEKERSESPMMGIEVKYKVFMVFDPPLVLGNSTKDHGLAAYLEMENFPKLITIAVKKERKPDFEVGENSQLDIAKYLVLNRYL